MKVRTLVCCGLISATILSGCGFNHSNDEDSDTASHAKKTEKHSSQSKSDHTSKDDHATSHGKSENHQEDYDDKALIAMTLHARNVDRYMITAKELKRGKYELQYQGLKGKDKYKSISELQLHKANIEHTPDGMKVYVVQPNKGPYRSYIAVSQKEIILFGSQSPFKFEDMHKGGIKFNTKRIVHKYHKAKDLDEMKDKINISDQPE